MYANEIIKATRMHKPIKVCKDHPEILSLEIDGIQHCHGHGILGEKEEECISKEWISH